MRLQFVAQCPSAVEPPGVSPFRLSIFVTGIFASFINSCGIFRFLQFPTGSQNLSRAFFAECRHDEGIEFPFELLVAHRIDRVA